MANTVVGFFDDADEARRAMEQLVAAGIDRSSIDISSSSASQTETSYSDSSEGSSSGHGRGNAISNFFNSLFGNDSDDARKYSRVGSEANTIVTVHASSSTEAERAADILDDAGAFDVDERSSQYNLSSSGGTDLSSGSGSYDTTGSITTGMTGTSDYRDNDSSDRSDSIERIEENLEVGKRSVETGGVRLRSRIVERPVEEHVRLREEHVEIERNPVNRKVSSDELRNFQEQEIEVTERAEVPVVSKEARVVEEITVSKEVTERDETVRDTVRNTEVDVDDVRTTGQTGQSGRTNQSLED